MTRGIWLTSPEHFALCTLREFSVQGVKCLSEKATEELCVMTLKGNAMFKEKLTDGLKNDIRNLVIFHATSQKSENLLFGGLLL